MDVSIIIVNYNTKDLILACIKSIIGQTSEINYEIIVIDNGSIDGSKQAIKDKYAHVIFVESNINRGFGCANNIGADLARGKYLLFLNPDTIILNNSVLTFYNFNENHAGQLKIGATGGRLKDENKLETGSFGPLPNKTNYLKHIFGLLPRFTGMDVIQSEYFQTNGFLEVGYITGADLFISKSIFQDVGGFDPNIFMYYEESDLQLRLKKEGYCHFVIKGTNIIHFEGGSFASVKSNAKKRQFMTKSMLYYFRKHSTNKSFLIFKTIYLILRLSTVFQPHYSLREKIEYLNCIIES